MPALSPTTQPADAGEWPETAVAIIRKELRGRVDVVIPGSPGTWDAETDSFVGGTEDVPIIYNRAARVRPLSFRAISSAADPRTVATHRTTIEMHDGDPLIPDGAVLVIRHGGKNRLLDGTRQLIQWAEASTESPFLFITGKAGD